MNTKIINADVTHLGHPDYMNQQKGFVNILILIVVIVVIAGVGGYFVLSEQTSSLEPWPMPTSISSKECSLSANLVIKNNKIKQINSCSEEKISVNGQEVSYVEIAYGPAGDCEAGCIYNYHYSIVVDGNEHEITQKPNRWGYGNDSIQIGQRFGCYLDPATDLTNVTLVQDKNEYKWKIVYDNMSKTDKYGNQCILNGYELTSLNGSRLNIFVTFPKFAESCGGKADCLNFIAIAKMDQSICKDVVGPARIDDCYSGIARRQLDNALCEKVSDGFSKKQCRESVEKYISIESQNR